jgi:tubulin---tyrosine ligase
MPPAVVLLHQTQRFQVLGSQDEKKHKEQEKVPNQAPLTKVDRKPPSSKKRSIFLDINEPYTRKVIQDALRERAPNCTVTLGTGEGDDEVPLPAGADFQWSEYERINWSAVLAGKHGASSYCVRKGLSRKAQLAYYTKLHVAKNPDSLLQHTLPKTVILDTWPVWEEDYGGGAKDGFADIVMGGASHSGGAGVGRKERLDKCLEEAKQVMNAAERDFDTELETNASADPPTWILKPSTVNKGQGIQIVHLHEQVVDICWTECDIREW